MRSVAEVARRLDAVLEEALEKVELGIVIMGPGRLAADSFEVQSPESVLRFELVRRCGEYGISVQPEHPLLTEAAVRLGDGYDLCTYETLLVRATDLVILIPASVGSYCELGWFGMHAETCVKMIVLCDSSKPREGSYLADGPVRAARHRRAVIEYIDYRNIEGSWAVVKRHVDALRASRTIAS